MAYWIGLSTEGRKCVFCGKSTYQYATEKVPGVEFSVGICSECFLSLNKEKFRKVARKAIRSFKKDIKNLEKMNGWK